MPSVERRDGHPGFAHGADLPPALLRELDSGATVWGHALQPGKQDWLATPSTPYWLNELRIAQLLRIRLFVSEEMLSDDVHGGPVATFTPACCSGIWLLRARPALEPSRAVPADAWLPLRLGL
ncbi:hypothetical protein PRJ39_15910 [Lysobacter enzymogenes]|uniref:hypothetical protein n=1 Tax=Lysobacter enzymogenes TaxID=69 RepID=UPI003749E3EA